MSNTGLKVQCAGHVSLSGDCCRPACRTHCNVVSSKREEMILVVSRRQRAATTTIPTTTPTTMPTTAPTTTPSKAALPHYNCLNSEQENLSLTVDGRTVKKTAVGCGFSLLLFSLKMSYFLLNYILRVPQRNWNTEVLIVVPAVVVPAVGGGACCSCDACLLQHDPLYNLPSNSACCNLPCNSACCNVSSVQALVSQDVLPRTTEMLPYLSWQKRLCVCHGPRISSTPLLPPLPSSPPPPPPPSPFSMSPPSRGRRRRLVVAQQPTNGTFVVC